MRAGPSPPPSRVNLAQWTGAAIADRRHIAVLIGQPVFHFGARAVLARLHRRDDALDRNGVVRVDGAQVSGEMPPASQEGLTEEPRQAFRGPAGLHQARGDEVPWATPPPEGGTEARGGGKGGAVKG